ncbi:molecular chaperone SurA [Rugosibacter aromaticivorans]|uniref:Chaperone SurA n=1 Tax=Rugosibacter aromaticivorans TaxID=1565605 RepID=A0A0C5J7B6_9PROT|nr:peptidylprolyl isomerase [Rugosibacter aromaticivorans]AJP47593.1 molecular chaperone SurA [Rugosibacter aromaticivorans]TBR14621.1 MAG: molecular chaperone SurA [Rugosibacter sp.]
MNIRSPLAVLLIFIAALSMPMSARARSASPVEVDRIVAVVNDEVITLQELQSRLASVERQMREQNVPLPPKSVIERQMLDRMISDRVQLQDAKETGLSVTDGELEDAIRRIAESNKLTLAAFRAALEKDGISWDKFREEIRSEITLSRLRDREVARRVSISDGEIENYINNPDSGAKSDNVAVNISHIVLRLPENPTPDQLMRIGARAQSALDQIRRGEDFAKVAASFSEAPDGLKGGALGLRPLDRLPALYADAVKKLQPGDVSEILRSPAGFHIIKLTEKRNGETNPLAVAAKQTHVRHILIKVNELVSAAEAEHKILSLKERLDNGADFADLARQYSNDLSASKGGDLGWLYAGDTVPEFEAAMDALKINQISGPVQSPFGFHLIQVLERRTGEMSLERQRMIARQVLRDRKADEVYQDWVRQLRDRAYVEDRLEDL